MIVKSVIALALLTPLFAADAVPPTAGLTVHEWGTFTSIAAADGSAEPWVSLSPPADLPCFVYHLSAQCLKCGANRVRMETPVIYFYSTQPLTASVHVDLPSGLITEWYPQGTQASRLQPGMTYGNRRGTSSGAAFRLRQVQRQRSSPAPETTATTMRPGRRTPHPCGLATRRRNCSSTAALPTSISPSGRSSCPTANWRFATPAPKRSGFAILFENRGGKTGYRVIRDLRGSVLTDSPDT